MTISLYLTNLGNQWDKYIPRKKKQSDSVLFKENATVAKNQYMPWPSMRIFVNCTLGNGIIENLMNAKSFSFKKI